MPLTDLGYERPTYDDILEAQIDRAKVLFGDDIDTNENTPLGKYIRLNVTDLADVYEILEKIYYSRFPNTARGISLDRLCPFAGITRNPATYAKHTVKFTGVAGEYVPEAFEVSAGDIIFHTYDSVLIGEDGTATAVVECETSGTAGNVTVGSIDTIVNPDTNVESIEHVSVYELATDIETDTELRYRFNQAARGIGTNNKASIISAITRVPLVDGVDVIENKTNDTVNGLPPHSFACYVLAPETQHTKIAEAILQTKPIGINPIGDINVDVLDENNVKQTISFYKMIQVDIKMRVDVYVDVNNYVENDTYTQVKDNIINFVNSMKNGYELNQRQIVACAFNVESVEDAFVEIYINDVVENTYKFNSNEIGKISSENLKICIYDISTYAYIGGDPEE